MAEGNGGQITTIVVALIGLAGVLGAAYISSRPKAVGLPTSTGPQSVAPFVGNSSGAATPTPDAGPAVAQKSDGPAAPVDNGSGTLPPATPAPSYPDFSGNWVEENSATPSRLQITQSGGQLSWAGRNLQIRPDGTAGYQQFAAGTGAGHLVSTADQADLIDTFTLARQGQELIFTTIFDVRHPYSNMPVGTTTRVMKYLREQ